MKIKKGVNHEGHEKHEEVKKKKRLTRRYESTKNNIDEFVKKALRA